MSGTSENQRQGYRPDIEGLRGVAVSLVVAFHALAKQIPGGFIGVDVFFVISGYLITGLLVREIEKTGALSLAGFYARRARRLLPASAFVFLATLLLCRVFLSPVQQYHLGASGSHTALYISNFWFMGRSADYFAPATANNPFLHTWSLAVEEQFYLVWPAIILLGLRGRHSRRTLFAVMILITAGSLGACLWFTRILAPWAFFSPLTRAWEFAAGGIAFLLAAQEARVSRGVRALGSWLGLAAILGAAVLLHGQAGWPGWLAVIPVAGTAAILNGRVPGFGAASILELRISQWVGRHSYSWYLWHWPLLAVTAVMQPPLFSRHLYVVVFCVGGSLALAAATHAVVENPIRFSRYLAPRRRLSLAGVGLVTLLTAGTALLWQHSASREVSALGLGKAVDASQGLEGCPAVGFSETRVIECDSGSPASKFTLVLLGLSCEPVVPCIQIHYQRPRMAPGPDLQAGMSHGPSDQFQHSSQQGIHGVRHLARSGDSTNSEDSTSGCGARQLPVAGLSAGRERTERDMARSIPQDPGNTGFRRPEDDCAAGYTIAGVRHPGLPCGRFLLVEQEAQFQKEYMHAGPCTGSRRRSLSRGTASGGRFAPQQCP